MTTTTMKAKTKISTKPKGVKKAAQKTKARSGKKSPWATIAMFLVFAGLVAYMFSPNVPNSQRSGAQTSSSAGFASGLSK